MLFKSTNVRAVSLEHNLQHILPFLGFVISLKNTVLYDMCEERPDRPHTKTNASSLAMMLEQFTTEICHTICMWNRSKLYKHTAHSEKR